jgi:hypothetical protein
MCPKLDAYTSCEPTVKPTQLARSLALIDLQNEHLISLSQAGKSLPSYRSNKPVSLSCVFRWVVDGVRLDSGEVVRLEAVRCGGRWLTSREAMQRFIDRQTPKFDRQPAENAAAKGKERSERAARELAEAGI